MKRIDTFSDEAKDVYLKTIEIAKIYGRCDWECGILDCDVCPLNENSNNCNCTVERSKEEWVAWAEEEIKDETDI